MCTPSQTSTDINDGNKVVARQIATRHGGGMLSENAALFVFGILLHYIIHHVFKPLLHSYFIALKVLEPHKPILFLIS